MAEAARGPSEREEWRGAEDDDHGTEMLGGFFLSLFVFVAWRLNAAYWKDIK